MDHAQIAALIASLSGDVPEGRFALLLAGGHDAAVPVALAPCPRPLGPEGIEGDMLVYGIVTVPEDHAKPEGATLELFFAVLRAGTSHPEPDPVVHLHGGPGMGIVASLEGFAGAFAPWRRTRDVVTFDRARPGSQIVRPPASRR